MGKDGLADFVQGLAPELFGFVGALADEDRRGGFLWAALEGAWIGNGDLVERLLGDGGGKAREAFGLAAFRQAFLLVKRDGGGSPPEGPLGELDVEERAVLHLRHHAPLTLDEAADVVDLDKARVFSLLHGARRKLGVAPWADPGPLGAGRGAGCVRAPWAAALVDVDAGEERHRPLVRHVRECAPCGRLYEEARRAADALAERVPRLRVPRVLQAGVERRVRLLVDRVPGRARPGPWTRALRALLGRPALS